MWKNYPKEVKDKFTFFIIDDCSKKPINEILSKDDLSGLDIHLYRVQKDLNYNIAGVRNLGAQECKTPWILILDTDCYVDTKCAKAMLDLAEKEMNNKKVFKFNRKITVDKSIGCHSISKQRSNVIHPGVCLLQKKDYWRIGGNEEDLVGNYGCTDGCFFHRCKKKVEIVNCQRIYLDYAQAYTKGVSWMPPRNGGANAKIASQHILNNTWSTDYVRFPWKKLQ
jgi:predicted glycosyltransferase involved in capsule biosynthesis